MSHLSHGFHDGGELFNCTTNSSSLPQQRFSMRCSRQQQLGILVGRLRESLGLDMRIHQFSVDLALVSHEMFELAKVMLQSLQAGG